MTLPIPTELPEPPIIYGNDCLLCFPAGQTPRYMTVFFSGITDCNPDQPPEHTPIPNIITLEQLHDSPCIWFGAPTEDWHCRYRLNVENVSYIDLWFRTYLYFQDTKPEHASKTFANELICSDSEPGGAGGTAFVPSHQVTAVVKNGREAFTIANTYNFSPPRLAYPAAERKTDPGEYEPDLSPADELRVSKILHVSDDTNILLQHVGSKSYG